MKALGKGWSLFAAVAAGAGKAVQQNIIQPGVEKAMDPTLRATASDYMSQASKRATELASGANDWSRSTLGVDVAEKARQTFVGQGNRGEYASLANQSGNDHSYNDDDDEDDFFNQHTAYDAPISSSSLASSKPTTTKPATQLHKDDDDDEWKDF